MNEATLKKQFEKIGARITVLRQPAQRWRGDAGSFSLNVISGDGPERFTLSVNEDDPPEDFRVVDSRPEDRHLLIKAGDHKLLCGHDERHWFVAAVPPSSSNVKTAKEQLKPSEVVRSEKGAKVKKGNRTKRKNAGGVRQGEWFFVPEPGFRPTAKAMLRKKEPLVRVVSGRRGSSKPHVAEEAYRIGGTTVYVSSRYPQGLTEQEYARLLQNDERARKWGWQIMSRDPTVYVKGKITHDDHSTVQLNGWHKAVLNTEGSYLEDLGIRVGFLD